MFVDPATSRRSQQPADACYRAFRDAAGRAVVLRPAGAAAATAALEAGERVEWGRDCREARRLAWLLLFDASASRTLADDWCESFAEEVVERLPHDGFVLARGEITSWLDTSP